MPLFHNKNHIFLLATLLCPLMSYAEKDIFSLSLNELMELKVSGVTEVEADFLWTPASINIFDNRVFQLSSIDNLNELAPLAPNFHVAKHDDSHHSSISVRGRRIGSSGREVLVLMDGMRIDNWYAGSGSFTMPNIGLLGSNKVEFIRGAISQLYGSGAYTGVINIQSDPDVRSSKVSVDEFGSLELQSNIGSSNGSFKQKLFLDLKHKQYAKAPILKPIENVPTELDASEKYLTAHYQAHWHDWSFYSILSQSEADGYYSVGSYSKDNTKEERAFYNLSIKHERNWSPKFHSLVQAGYRYFDFITELELLPSNALLSSSSPASSDPFFIKNIKNEDYEFWLNWKNKFRLSEHNYIQAGLEWRDIHKSEVRFLGNYDLEALANQDFPIASSNDLDIITTGLESQTEQLLAVYLQSITRITDSDELTLGLRHDSYDSVGENTAPRVAWVHTFSPQSSIKFIYGEAFRAPMANELYLKNNPIILGNTQLKPEIVKTSEVVGLFQNKKAQLQLGYFYSEFKDPIAQKSIGANVRQFNNLEDSSAQGLEGNLSYQLKSNLIGRINLSHMLDKPEDQYRMPNELAIISLLYQNFPWTWNYSVNYTSSRESNPPESTTPNYLSSYWLNHSNIQYHFNSSNKLTLQIQNLFDKEYEEASIGDNNNLIPGIGRTIKLSYSTEF